MKLVALACASLLVGCGGGKQGGGAPAAPAAPAAPLPSAEPSAPPPTTAELVARMVAEPTRFGVIAAPGWVVWMQADGAIPAVMLASPGHNDSEMAMVADALVVDGVAPAVATPAVIEARLRGLLGDGARGCELAPWPLQGGKPAAEMRLPGSELSLVFRPGAPLHRSTFAVRDGSGRVVHEVAAPADIDPASTCSGGGGCGEIVRFEPHQLCVAPDGPGRIAMTVWLSRYADADPYEETFALPLDAAEAAAVAAASPPAPGTEPARWPPSGGALSADDEQLREDVDAMLAAHRERGLFTVEPARLVTVNVVPADERFPEHIYVNARREGEITRDDSPRTNQPRWPELALRAGAARDEVSLTIFEGLRGRSAHGCRLQAWPTRGYTQLPEAKVAGFTVRWKNSRRSTGTDVLSLVDAKGKVIAKRTATGVVPRALCLADDGAGVALDYVVATDDAQDVSSVVVFALPPRP